MLPQISNLSACLLLLNAQALLLWRTHLASKPVVGRYLKIRLHMRSPCFFCIWGWRAVFDNRNRISIHFKFGLFVLIPSFLLSLIFELSIQVLDFFQYYSAILVVTDYTFLGHLSLRRGCRFFSFGVTKLPSLWKFRSLVSPVFCRSPYLWKALHFPRSHRRTLECTCKVPVVVQTFCISVLNWDRTKQDC